MGDMYTCVVRLHVALYRRKLLTQSRTDCFVMFLRTIKIHHQLLMSRT
jgi:hypothetical protein